MKLASYLDYYDWGLDKQLSLFEDNQLDYFILRKIDGLSFLSYQEAILDYQKQLKRTKIGLFDPLLAPIDLEDETSVNDLSLAVKFAKVIKAKTIAITIKAFNAENIDEEALIDYFKGIIKITKRLQVVVKTTDENPMHVYNLIANLNKVKKIKLIYNPANIYIKDYSPITAYRLFKQKMGIFEVADVDERKLAILLGHGEIDIKSLFKKLYRDRFKGLICLNSNLDEVFKNFGVDSAQVNKKEKKSNLKKYLTTINQLGYVNYETKEEVPFENIIEHQIKLLKVVFK